MIYKNKIKKCIKTEEENDAESLRADLDFAIENSKTFEDFKKNWLG